MNWYGRAFELADGTIVLPCDYCGSPVPRVELHTCPDFMQALLEIAQQRDEV